MPTFKKDIKLGTNVPLVKTDDINDGAVTRDKLSSEMRKLLEKIENGFVEAIPKDEIEKITQ